MPARNLFRKPFDDGTKVKLTLFEGYLLEWLPVFLSPNKIIWRTINVFDFFAGEGFDNAGQQGSPILILENILKYEKFIRKNNLKINVFLNEYDRNKFEILENHLEKYTHFEYINIYNSNKDFQVVFKELYPLINDKDAASLVFLDQNGIKQINKDVFLRLLSAKTTDFLFFISSSLFTRFSDHEAFVKHIAIEKNDLDNENYYNIHRTIFKYYKDLIPTAVEYYLAPFSIKKGANIYGLIFGTHHTLGIEKFLKQSWKLDKVRGEANFDIDNEDRYLGQVDMFSNKVLGPKKLTAFENELKELILQKKLKTNYHTYVHALTNGFLPKHANSVLKSLRTDGTIKSDYNGMSGDIHKIKEINKQTIIQL